MTTSPITPAHLIAITDPAEAGNPDPINRAKANHPSNSKAVKAIQKELDENWWMNSDGIMLSSMPEALEARHYPIFQAVSNAHNQRIYQTRIKQGIDVFNAKRRELSVQITPTITQIPSLSATPKKKWWQI